MIILRFLFDYVFPALTNFARLFSWLWDTAFGVVTLSYLFALIPLALFFLVRGATQGKKLTEKSVLIPLIFLSIMAFMFALSALFARFV